MSVILSNKQGGIVTSFEMTNFSTAKQKFSFGKGPRFPSVQKSITDNNYDLPSCFGRRAPSFGVGDRFNQKVDRSGKSKNPSAAFFVFEFQLTKLFLKAAN